MSFVYKQPTEMDHFVGQRKKKLKNNLNLYNLNYLKIIF